MSSEDVVRLFQAAAQDQALGRRLDRAGSPEKVVAIGAEQGYEFTPRELQDVLEDMHRQVSEELSDEELEGVAGGFDSPVVRPALNATIPEPVWSQGFFNEAILAERWLFIC